MEYVSRVLLEVNGQAIEDFKSVTEGEVDVHGEVKLMNKTGFISKLSRPGCKVEYVIPSDKEEFDFNQVKNGTLIIDKMNGKRVRYSGVYTLKVGETKYDGENEAVRTIDFGAAAVK